MKVIIDRFEGNYVVCEKGDKTTISIEKDSIPKDAKAGDILIINDDKTIILDIKASEKRKREIEDLTKDMWE